VLSKSQKRFALDDEGWQARRRASAGGFAVFESVFVQFEAKVRVRAITDNTTETRP
jgi:hypothetical protein